MVSNRRARGPDRTCSERFPCDVRSPGRARHFCDREMAEALNGWSGLEDCSYTVSVIVSELVTNAINAGCAEVRLDLAIRTGHVRVSVHDDAPGWPEIVDAAPQNRHGRGLAITAALSGTWGVDTTAPGKSVWAEVALAQ